LAIFRSSVYESLFEEFLSETKTNSSKILTDTKIIYWHDIHDFINVTEDKLDGLKRAFLPEIASQFRFVCFVCLPLSKAPFRDGQMLASLSFRGYGAFLQTGFSTDMSENCLWLTPYVRKPEGTPTHLENTQPYCKMGANNGIKV